MIPRATATIHAENSSPLHSCWLSTNITTKAASNAATMITDGLGLQNCKRGIGKPRMLALLKVWWVRLVSGMLTTLIWQYQWQWQWRRWWAASGSLHRCRRVKMRLILWLRNTDFTEITVSNSNDDLHLLQATNVRLRVRCRTFRKWRCEDGVTLDVPSVSSVLITSNFFGSRPSTNGVGMGFYHLRR